MTANNDTTITPETQKILDRKLAISGTLCALGAVAFGRLTKQGIWPLDGTPNLVTSAFIWSIEKGYQILKNKPLKLNQVEIVPHITRWFKNPETKLKASQDYFNAVKGAAVGSVPLALYRYYTNPTPEDIEMAKTIDKVKLFRTSSQNPPTSSLPDEPSPITRVEQSSQMHQGKLFNLGQQHVI